MKITFVRHGESQVNRLQVISNRGLRYPLTLTGRQQAAALADRLQDQRVTRIYSSPLLRALETAIILADRLGVEYEVAEALRENDLGVLEGQSSPEAWQACKMLFEAWCVHKNWEQTILEAEPFSQVRERFVPFIEGLIQQFGDTQAHLVCVSHGGLYWLMLPLVLHNVDNALINRQGGFDHTTCVEAELRPSGLVCTAWNGIPIPV
jgi:broad specificity phosphatase PhoE